MKRLIFIIYLAPVFLFSQLSLNEAKINARQYGYTFYSYHAEFIGHQGYGAPIVLTNDGGCIFWGTADSTENAWVVKLDENGELEWKTILEPQFDEIETQSVIQDDEGRYYAFLLSYNREAYRGGTERVIHLDGNGQLIWDKFLGDHALANNPMCAHIRLMSDGSLKLKGHIAEAGASEKEKVNYLFWIGSLDHEGLLSEKTGEIINWLDNSWSKFNQVKE